MRAVGEGAVEGEAPVVVPGQRVGTRLAVLALGYVALLAVGAINLVEGDLTGAGLVLLGGFGLLRLKSRLAGLVVWLTAALNRSGRCRRRRPSGLASCRSGNRRSSRSGLA